MKKPTKIKNIIVSITALFFILSCSSEDNSALKSRLDCEKKISTYRNNQGSPQGITQQNNSTIKYEYPTEGYSVSFHWGNSLNSCLTVKEYRH